jgi:YrbI family 3-deoxy-D-manno-octulosonate 8-phosphate phosphatase
MGDVIAFIPVRGGSKSIPLKNVKEFCGKPLVYWNINALQQISSINKIIVATDSDIIETVVNNFHFNKVEIYRRLAENASDSASTESVMLEYLQSAKPSYDSTFILVQATSPLTEPNHFVEAIDLYNQGLYDSILTCVRFYRFFWNQDGTSKNYNFKARPRRQDFEGEMMENGAFYINSVSNILTSKNRLSGKIGIYIMPNHTAYEIDEPEDWPLMEKLMYKYVLDKHITKSSIKLFLTDVDGVLTDGGMYYSDKGDELKKFNTRDGMGLELLRNAGIKTGIITSENSNIVSLRAKKLKVDYLYQGQREGGKLAVAREICEKEGITLKEVAYIGDDINCFDLLTNVGIAACPNDAVKKIKSIDQIRILNNKGGEGAVREFAEIVIEQFVNL